MKLILIMIVCVIGALLASVTPADWVYLVGFIIGLLVGTIINWD